MNTGKTRWKKGQIPWNKGKKIGKQSKETKRKRSNSMKGKNKGKIRSIKIKKQMNISAKNRKIHGMLGKTHSKETKLKIRNKNKGENGSNWQGGISLELYPLEFDNDLKKLIRKRDNYICQECGLHQDELKIWNKELDIHHIDYNKDNLNPENLITLCRSCHMKTNFNRENWIIYFIESKKEGKNSNGF